MVHRTVVPAFTRIASGAIETLRIAICTVPVRTGVRQGAVRRTSGVVSMWIDAGELEPVEAGARGGGTRAGARRGRRRSRSLSRCRGARAGAAVEEPQPQRARITHASAPAAGTALIRSDASGAPRRAGWEHLHSPLSAMTPHFLTGAELTAAELDELLARAEELKREPLRSNALRGTQRGADLPEALHAHAPVVRGGRRTSWAASR